MKKSLAVCLLLALSSAANGSQTADGLKYKKLWCGKPYFLIQAARVNVCRANDLPQVNKYLLFLIHLGHGCSVFIHENYKRTVAKSVFN